MNRLALAGAKCRRLVTRQTVSISLAICIVWFFILQFRGDISHQWTELGNHIPDLRTPPKRMPTHNILPPLSERVLCHGPRGHLLGKSVDDDLVERELDGRKQQPSSPRNGNCAC